MKDFLTKKKYYDHDDFNYVGIRNIETLFNDIDKKDYYKPIKTYSAFSGNYKKYENRGDRKQNISKTISLHVYTIFTQYDKWS